jgi:predicted NUDIX family NTP pyrophosphohydrolase
MGDVDTNNIVSNTIEIDWPPRSGKKLTIPEIDRGGWFTPEEAIEKIHEYQRPLLKAAAEMIEL